jgi:hypothetical protein
MKSYPAPPFPEAVVATMQRLVDAGIQQGELIAAMRAAGLGIIPSIKLLRRFYGLSASDAKVAVHLSETWSDCRDGNDSLHEAAYSAAKELGFEDSASKIREEIAS